MLGNLTCEIPVVQFTIDLCMALYVFVFLNLERLFPNITEGKKIVASFNSCFFYGNIYLMFNFCSFYCAAGQLRWLMHENCIFRSCVRIPSVVFFLERESEQSNKSFSAQLESEKSRNHRSQLYLYGKLLVRNLCIDREEKTHSIK